MNTLMPETTTSTEIQRNFKKVAARAKKLKKPLVVLSNNKPEFIIMDHDSFGRQYSAVSKKAKSDYSEFLGRWTKKEADEFDKNIEEMFEQIDWEMWK